MVTTKKQKQRKMLMVLPMLAVPFLTVLFWSLGGGRSDGSEKPLQEKGLNQALPETAVPETGFSKLNYYDRAEQDSSRQRTLQNKDPFFMTNKPLEEVFDYEIDSGDKLVKSSFRSPQEEKVVERLKALQSAVAQPPQPRGDRFRASERETSSKTDADIKRLEAIASSIETAPEEDREMQQINGMLQNILDIQHPQRVQDRMKKEQRLREGKASAIAMPSENNVIGDLSKEVTSGKADTFSNDFFSLEDNQSVGPDKNAIEAVIAESQVCVNGSIIKLRLSQDIELDGVRIPKNTFVFGTASLKGERLNVEIASIRFQSSVFVVELLLYDMDGMEGIYIPGAISREVAKASAERSIQPLGITSLDDSWGAQAAGAGIEAAKSLMSKKVKQVKATVKSGYHVLLKDKKRNNNNN